MLPALLLAWSGATLAAPLPEAQLALTHLRAGERERAEAAVGPMGDVPLYLAELQVDPKERRISGQLRLRVVARGGPLRSVPLRLVPNAFGAERVRLNEVASDLGPVEVARPEP